MPAAHDTAPRTTAWPLGCKQEGLALELRGRGRGRGHPTATWRGKCPWVYGADPVPKKSELRFLRASEWEQHRPRRPPAPHTHAPALQPPLRAGGEKQRADALCACVRGTRPRRLRSRRTCCQRPAPRWSRLPRSGTRGCLCVRPHPPASLKPLARTGSHVSHCVIFHSHCSGIERRGTCRISPSSSSPSTRSAE